MRANKTVRSFTLRGSLAIGFIANLHMPPYNPFQYGMDTLLEIKPSCAGVLACNGSTGCCPDFRGIGWKDGLHKSCGSAREDVDFELDLAELELGSRQASALGLIANELVTNALKHGPQANRIIVRLQRDGNRALLVVQGKGELPAGFSIEGQNGFGLVLSAELARQLGGTLDFRSTDGSVEFFVEFPVAAGQHQA